MLLFADNKVVTLVRPKKHSVHPAGTFSLMSAQEMSPTLEKLTLTLDLHLLLNTVSSSALSSTLDSSSWLPICLPKYNANGFLYAYVSFMSKPDALGPPPVPPSEARPPDSSRDQATGDREESHAPEVSGDDVKAGGGDVHVGLAVVTANRDGFERLQEWAGTVIEVRFRWTVTAGGALPFTHPAG